LEGVIQPVREADSPMCRAEVKHGQSHRTTGFRKVM
jgi:hypothetical protein